MRTTRKILVFREPFRLKALDGIQPPGSYEIVTDEERIPALLFEAWRRVKTQIRLPALEGKSGLEQYTIVDPGDLEDALLSDAQEMRRDRARQIHD